MKLHLSQHQYYQTITAYNQDSVEVNAVSFRHSLLVLPEVAPIAWPVKHFDHLTEQHFQHIAQLQPELVILGTGVKQHFIHPKLTTCLSNERIGVECMDSQAACRTYNILVAEDRKVVLALILENE